jgi:hypothetical protein
MSLETIRQYVYLSRALEAFPPEKLERLAIRSEERNRDGDVGGALLFGRGLFLQALEGAPEAVDAVLERIKLDPRHTSIRMLVDHEVDRRSFRKWAMTPISLDSHSEWTPEHARAVEQMAGVARVAKPGSAAHSLIGSFTKHVQRLVA